MRGVTEDRRKSSIAPVPVNLQSSVGRKQRAERGLGKVGKNCLTKAYKVEYNPKQPEHSIPCRALFPGCFRTTFQIQK